MESSSFLASIGWLPYAGLALSLLMTVGCARTPAQNQNDQNQAPGAVSKEESQEIAAEFLRNSPTFRFDGMENTLKLVRSEVGEKPYNWVFHYEFQSRHAGYGDRTGLILAQVIIDHRAEIVVEQGEVIYAVLDGRWDMLRQRMIE
ncbi:hypothetical protein ES703_92354 [subsurface metagenome]